MSAEDLIPAESLLSFLGHVERTEKLPFDEWKGKRAHTRRLLNAPIAVSRVSRNVAGPYANGTLRDISETGLCFVALSPYESGQELLVAFRVHDIIWAGRMRVSHCTETLNGYRVGAEWMGDLQSRLLQTPDRPPSGPDQAAQRAAQDREWLKKMRPEIERAMRDYRLAKKTFGLMGVSVQKRIQQLIRSLPPETEATVPAPRRVHPRHRTPLETFIVLSIQAEWRRLPAAFVDLSEGGVGLLIPYNLTAGEIERAMTGDWFVYVGMPLLVGLQGAEGILWIPGEVVRTADPQDGIIRAGVRFATPRAMAFFGAA